MKLDWNFPGGGGGGGFKTTNPVGEYGYFLELHNANVQQFGLLKAKQYFPLSIVFN